MSDDPFIEVRGEVLRETVDIMDAVVQATPGSSRTTLLRQILAEWAAREIHRATLVTRIANSNGNAPESDRNRAGNVTGGGRR